jgi:hypothetical protein
MFVTFVLRIVMKNAGEHVDVILPYFSCKYLTTILYVFASTTYVPHTLAISYYLIRLHKYYLVAIRNLKIFYSLLTNLRKSIDT